MRQKTERRLANREKIKPRHHIDTCVIIESAKDTKLGHVCKRYLNLVGFAYKGYFSLPVIGEYFMKVLGEISETVKQDQMFDYFRNLIGGKKIGFHVLENTALKGELKALDSRMGSTDASIVACAVESGAILVTLDKMLIHNKVVEENYRIKLVHPKEFC